VLSQLLSFIYSGVENNANHQTYKGLCILMTHGANNFLLNLTLDIITSCCQNKKNSCQC